MSLVYKERPTFRDALEIEASRMTIIQMIGYGSVGWGLLLAITGPAAGPSFGLFHLLPGWPVLYGTMTSIFGVVMVYGLTSDRTKVLVTGSYLVAWSFVLFSSVYVAQFALWALNFPQSEFSPSVSQVAPYLTIAGLIFAQINVIRRRAEKDRDDVAATMTEGDDG